MRYSVYEPLPLINLANQTVCRHQGEREEEKLIRAINVEVKQLQEMNYYRNAREAELSLLAQGRGLIDGGVELDCFADDRRSYSLQGEAFIKPSRSPDGQHAKPYKRVQLALPKTYVTRRGQMVLFTSPEDMIVGQSVTLQYRKEVTSTSAANRLKTVNKLVSSSMDYDPVKEPLSEVGEFTPVYLQRLREAAERAKETENYSAQSIDKDENMEEEDLEGADSGMGASLHPSSSGRLSSMSHFSESTVIQIPGDRLAEEKEEEENDPLKLLAGELAGHMKSDQKTKAKANGGKSKKRKTASDSTNQKQKSSSIKTKTKKRKKSKKTAAQKDIIDGSDASRVKDNSSLAALERKRREKLELERQRDEEARERARLEEELKRLRETQTGIATGGDVEATANQGDNRGTGGRRGSVVMTKGGTSERMQINSCHRKRENTEGTRLTEAEKAQRAREAYEKGAKLREQQNYNNHAELNSLRISQSITPAYTYSYFRYVPPWGAEKSTGGTATRGSRRGQQTKRQRPPKK